MIRLFTTSSSVILFHTLSRLCTIISFGLICSNITHLSSWAPSSGHDWQRRNWYGGENLVLLSPPRPSLFALREPINPISRAIRLTELCAVWCSDVWDRPQRIPGAKCSLAVISRAHFWDVGGMRVDYPRLWQLCVHDNAYLFTFSPALKSRRSHLSGGRRYQTAVGGSRTSENGVWPIKLLEELELI